MKIINTTDSSFKEEFKTILARAKTDMNEVSSIVQTLIDEIIQNQNDAIKEHIAKFDKWDVQSDNELQIDTQSMKEAYVKLDAPLRDALHIAYDKIGRAHV